MPLLDFWHSNPDTIATMNIVQVVAMAGDGKLKDSSNCCDELRKYLQLAPLEFLGKYAERCLSESFTSSGHVLQDIINELGRRLDHDVTNGRYQGVVGKIGFDGIWKSPEHRSLIVEAKTTDAYRIKLQTLIDYRGKLIAEGTVGSNTSILIVVGREDTGELEAQVRGSRHAWDIRLISVDALLSLVRIKQETDDPATAEKIRTVLVPFDYTRLDEIIEIMFATAKDLDAAIEETPTTESTENAPFNDSPPSTDTIAINTKRDQLIRAMSEKLDVGLVRKTKATYWDISREIRVVCSISKPYSDSIYRYWYAYHPTWDEFLAGGTQGYMIWGATDLDFSFVFSRGEFQRLLGGMLTTTRLNGKIYWHVKIIEAEAGRYSLHLPHTGKDLSLETHKVLGVRLTPAAKHN